MFAILNTLLLLLWNILFFAFTILSVIVIFKLGLCVKHYGISKIWKIDLKKKYGSWAVVTGGTKGIGRSYANELAKRGLNIVIISIGMEDLKEVSQEIKSKYGVEVEILEINFMDGLEVYKEIENKLIDKDIGILVNNVGVGLFRLEPFVDIPENVILANLTVNINAVTFMTRMILPQMIRNGRGAIVNLSSMSSMFPMSYMAPYSASKAYVRFLSDCIRDELKDTPITVQTVKPYYISTTMCRNFKGMQQPSYFIPSAEEFAASAICTLGYADVTAGCFTHEVIGTLMSILHWFLPEWISITLMGNMHQDLNVDKSKTS